MTKIPLRKESIIYLLFLGLITIILYIFLPILSIFNNNVNRIPIHGITVIGVIK